MKEEVQDKMKLGFEVSFKSFVEEVSESIGILMLSSFGAGYLSGNIGQIDFEISKEKLRGVLRGSSSAYVRVFADNVHILNAAVDEALKVAKEEFLDGFGVELEVSNSYHWISVWEKKC